MKNVLVSFFISFVLFSCHKETGKAGQVGCDMNKVYTDNAKKVTITVGVWGTVSNMEGDFMPMVPPCNSCGHHCPVQRTVKIYDYTLFSEGITSEPYSGFYDSLKTSLIAQVDTDADGFFQVDIPPGHYSMMVVENGKLYANLMDGQGGINPFTLTTGIENVNIVMTYKATF